MMTVWPDADLVIRPYGADRWEFPTPPHQIQLRLPMSTAVPAETLGLVLLLSTEL